MNTTKVGAGPLSLAAVAALALGTIALAPSADAATGPSAYRSHAPSASVANGTLTILGSRHDDHVTLALSADSSHLLVDLGDGSGVRSIDRATFTNVAAFLGAGDDTFTATGVPIPMTVHGGSGDDTITGGAADDELFGGRGNDAILGGDGNDVIFGGRGDDVVDGQRGTDTEFLGRGDDRAAWFPGEGNDNVDGGSGVDTLAFDGSNGNEKFAVSASGPHAVLTRDLGNIRMDTADVEVLDLAALGGTDVVKVGDLSGTALRETDVDLGGTRNGASDGQLDTVEVDGSDHADRVSVNADGSAVDVRGLPAHVRLQGSDTRDQLQVDTGAGDDQVSVSRAAQALIEVGVDLGTDQH